MPEKCNLAQLGPVGQSWQSLAKVAPSLAKFRPMLARCGQNMAEQPWSKYDRKYPPKCSWRHVSSIDRGCSQLLDSKRANKNGMTRCDRPALVARNPPYTAVSILQKMSARCDQGGCRDGGEDRRWQAAAEHPKLGSSRTCFRAFISRHPAGTMHVLRVEPNPTPQRPQTWSNQPSTNGRTNSVDINRHVVVVHSAFVVSLVAPFKGFCGQLCRG